MNPVRRQSPTGTVKFRVAVVSGAGGKVGPHVRSTDGRNHKCRRASEVGSPCGTFAANGLVKIKGKFLVDFGPLPTKNHKTKARQNLPDHEEASAIRLKTSPRLPAGKRYGTTASWHAYETPMAGPRPVAGQRGAT